MPARGVRRQPRQCRPPQQQLRSIEYPRVIPNSDGAGSSTRSVDGVTRFKAGQRVWLSNGQRNGRAFGTAADISLAGTSRDAAAGQSVVCEGAALRHPRHDSVDLPLLQRPDRRTDISSPAAPAPSVTMPCNSPNGRRQGDQRPSVRRPRPSRHRLAGADLVIDYRDRCRRQAMAFTRQRGVDRVVDVDFQQYRDDAEADGHRIPRSRSTPPTAIARLSCRCAKLMKMHRTARAGAVRTATAALRRPGGHFEVAGSRSTHHNVAGQFALSDTAPARLAVEKGDSSHVVVDCAR